MKKTILVLALVSLFLMNAVPSHAHSDDWGWAAAGAAVGLVTGAIIADSAYHSHGDYYYAQPCYPAQPVYDAYPYPYHNCWHRYPAYSYYHRPVYYEECYY
ncbi:MAG: hypothetical protein HYS08_06640 [Chlamydiae bacterium]|nr:hypothetical protein [Chlamydiota bacterium]MBI3267078.1 hypothetical protein [Chlamydiota bacterium]